MSNEYKIRTTRHRYLFQLKNPSTRHTPLDFSHVIHLNAFGTASLYYDYRCRPQPTTLTVVLRNRFPIGSRRAKYNVHGYANAFPSVALTNLLQKAQFIRLKSERVFAV